MPAYTDPNQGDTAFFEPWQGPGRERGFTLDAKMFPHDRPMSFYFGTRKIGDPQFRGHGDATLSIDCLAQALPEKLAVRFKHRLPGEYSQEFSADVVPAASDTDAEKKTELTSEPSRSPWHTLNMQREQFRNLPGRRASRLGTRRVFHAARDKPRRTSAGVQAARAGRRGNKPLVTRWPESALSSAART